MFRKIPLSRRLHIPQGCVMVLTWFAFELSVSIISDRTRTMSDPVRDPALRVRSAGALFQTGIPAHVIRTAFFTRFAVVVPFAGISGALDVRLSLEPVGTSAHGPVIVDVTFGTLAARRVGPVAGIFAFSVLTRSIPGAIRARTASHRANSVRTYVTLNILRSTFYDQHFLINFLTSSCYITVGQFVLELHFVLHVSI